MGDLAMTIAEEKPSEPSFQALPGKAVGVLVGDAHAVMAREGRKGPDGAVGFARGKGSYRRVYVPASAAGDDCLDIVLKVGMDGKTRKRFPGVELLRQPMLKPQGLDAAFQLVEVEVNEGQGSPASECFVATRITPLDGTKDYPLRVSETIAKLRKEAADQLKARADDIEKALAKQQKDVLGEKKPTGPGGIPADLCDLAARNREAARRIPQVDHRRPLLLRGRDKEGSRLRDGRAEGGAALRHHLRG